MINLGPSWLVCCPRHVSCFSDTDGNLLLISAFCRGKNPLNHYQSPCPNHNSCYYYVQCVNSRGFIKRCAPGTLRNPNGGIYNPCDHARNVPQQQQQRCQTGQNIAPNQGTTDGLAQNNQIGQNMGNTFVGFQYQTQGNNADGPNFRNSMYSIGGEEPQGYNYRRN